MYNISMSVTNKENLTSCVLCPRNCGVNRAAGKNGVCGVPADIYVARAALHEWEEPCISGYPDEGTEEGRRILEAGRKDPEGKHVRGSGAVFFAGCNLKCIFCQNYELSHARAGEKITVERLADIFLELEQKGALNINLVTPTQYVPQIAEAAGMARRRGMKLPFVFNCGGYEDPDALRLLDGICDIYLTDFKYMDEGLAKAFSGAADYPAWAKRGLAEMVRQCPEAVFDEEGSMKKGVIVRHLLLPGHVRNAKAVVDYVYETYGDSVWLSLMNQYTPFDRVREMYPQYPELGRKVTAREYDRLVDHAINMGIKNAFIQAEGTAAESFIPAFDGEGVWK